jgi:3-dehydroquinate synthase
VDSACTRRRRASAEFRRFGRASPQASCLLTVIMRKMTGMEAIEQRIEYTVRYPVHFSSRVFDPDNTLLREVIAGPAPGAPARLMVVVDRGVQRHHPRLLSAIEEYCRRHGDALQPACPPLVVPGGERTKTEAQHVNVLHEVISDAALCRRSYVVVVGGGSVLDMASYAAATARRGLRTVRVPTTVLAQADAGVSLTAHLNACGRKDFLGVLAPPFAVLNDTGFLLTLPNLDWKGGLAEAAKAAVAADRALFDDVEANAWRLASRDLDAMAEVVRRSAILHLRHAARDLDPGAPRSLDIGHWAAHRLEQLTHFSLRHGEAVAVGLALDATYSFLVGALPRAEWERVLATLAALGLDLYTPALGRFADDPADPRSIWGGLPDFHAGSGGALRIPLPRGVGRTVEADSLEPGALRDSIAILKRSVVPAHGGVAVPA